MTDNTYTRTVYQNESIHIDTNNDYISVKAKNDIKYGELLLIEHIFRGTDNICTLVIRENEYLYNELYPRISKWSKNERDDANTKSIKNRFSEDGGIYYLGNMMSKINHSCDSNCIILCVKKKIFDDLIINYLILYSIKNITKEDEITIMYGHIRGHNNEDDFECGCRQSAEDRQKRWIIVNNIGNRIQKTEHIRLDNIIVEYEKLSESKNTMMYQYLASCGYVISNDRVCITQQFIDFVKENTKNGDGSNDERIKHILDYVKRIFFRTS
jgi:hypothetical protein